MTREEALQKAREKLHQYIYLSETVVSPGLAKVYNNFSDWLGKVVYLAEVGLAALREQEERSKNEPLTLDELRDMAGEWVWVEVKYKDSQCNGWAFVATPTYIAYLDQTLPVDFYGKKFTAYRHKPDGRNLGSSLKHGEHVCSRCGQKRPVVCTVDGNPWCEACFEEAMSVFGEK